MSQNNGGNANKEVHARHDQAVAAQNREMRERAWRRLDERLNRFIRAGVKDNLEHRQRMREIDEQIKKIAALQSVTALYLSSLGRTGTKIDGDRP